MKNYLSMGFGVNSVAMHLHLLDKGVDFESVFVHHGTDWPETYNYAAGFQWWLKSRGLRPVTILRPAQRGSRPSGTYDVVYDNLYDHSWGLKMFPSRVSRWCTDKFKTSVLSRYHKKPCFVFIGYDWDERHRAKITSKSGMEFRWPLIEADIGRDGCKQIISDHGLPIPMKSGCYICPFQRVCTLNCFAN